MSDAPFPQLAEHEHEVQSLQAEARIVRSRLAEDVEALAIKVSPQHLKEEAKAPFVAFRYKVVGVVRGVTSRVSAAMKRIAHARHRYTRSIPHSAGHDKFPALTRS